MSQDSANGSIKTSIFDHQKSSGLIALIVWLPKSLPILNHLKKRLFD